MSCLFKLSGIYDFIKMTKNVGVMCKLRIATLAVVLQKLRVLTPYDRFLGTVFIYLHYVVSFRALPTLKMKS